MSIKDKIELYIEGRLSEDEQKAFLNELKSDKELTDKVEEYKEIYNSLKKFLKYKSPKIKPDETEISIISNVDELLINEDLEKYYYEYKGEKSQTEKLLNDFVNKKKNKKYNIKNIQLPILIKIAAVFILIAFASFIVLKNSGIEFFQNKYYKIITSYYQPQNDPNILSFLPKELTFKDKTLQINNPPPNLAIIYYKDLQRGENTNNKRLFFHALFTFQDEKYYDAAVLFKQIRDSGEEEISAAAGYYFIISLIQLEKYGLALKEIDTMMEEDHDYHSQLMEIRKIIQEK